MRGLSCLDHDILAKQRELDELEQQRAEVYGAIKREVLAQLIATLDDQAEELHSLKGHAGSLGGCFDAQCARARRCATEIERAGRP